jgi:SAM-dependent methyltransferase
MAAFNVYDDARRAETYARLEFPGTYYLAYRDLPDLIGKHVTGKRALDFGCGAGRSTRFLKQLGFQAAGVDIAPDMISKARALDPEGDYRLIPDGDLRCFGDGDFDLVLSAFTFDNVPTAERKVAILQELARLVGVDGSIVNLVSAPEIYLHEWASFSTNDFPENRLARSGDTVRIVITATEDPRPVEDIVWSDQAYLEVYARAGLEILEQRRPLGLETEPYKWINETRIAPWVIYVLRTARAVPGR